MKTFKQIYQVTKIENRPGQEIQLVLVSSNGYGATMDSQLRVKLDDFVRFSKGTKLTIGDYISLTVEHTGNDYVDGNPSEEPKEPGVVK